MTIEAAEPADTAPLLGGAGQSPGRPAGPSVAAAAAVATPPPPPSSKAAHLDLRFRQRFLAILRLLRPYAALALAALSILESITVAEVGKIAGSFYRIVVDHQPGLLAGAMVHAALLYAACCAIYATGTCLAQSLAVRWRWRLTAHLQEGYCRGGAFYRLQQKLDNPDQRIAFDASALCDSLGEVVKVAAAAPFKVAYYSWLTAGYTGWRGLAAVFAFFWAAALLQRLVMAPVARTVYRQEVREGDLRFAHLRLREYAAEAAQYGAGAAEARQLDMALRAAVENQQRLVWWRTALAATTRGIDYGGAMLNYVLVAAAVFAGMAGAPSGDSGALAQWVSNASFATLMLIYSFTELLDLSKHLSNMAGLTARVGQMLEALDPAPAAAQECSAAGGLQWGGSTCGSASSHTHPPPVLPSPKPPRVASGGLWQAGRRAQLGWQLGQWLRRGSAEGQKGSSAAYRRVGSCDRLAEAGLAIDVGQELQPSELAQQLVPPTLLPGALPDGSALEVSIHLLGPDLQREVLALFPGGHCHRGTLPPAPLGAPPPALPPAHHHHHQQQQQQQRATGPDAPGGEGRGEAIECQEPTAFLACLTFQFAAGGVSLAPDSSAHTLDKAAVEMDRMLHNYLGWERAVRAELAARGPYWCDSIDPRSGMALHGRQGAKWSEVAAAHALLGYERREAGICPVILHPTHGSSAYPATLFTDAPAHVLRAAIAVASHLEHPGPLAGPPAATLHPIPAAAASTLAPPPLPHNALQHAPQGLAPSPGLPLAQQPLLELHGVTLRRPDGGLAVSQLTLSLPRGAHLLISGPNGCGKSTLLKALCGLVPLEAGWARVGGAAVVAAAEGACGGAVALRLPPAAAAGPCLQPAAARQPAAQAAPAALLAEAPLVPADAPAGGVMVVPQRPLAAPGSELWQQVAYPDTRQLPQVELRQLLSAVGLGYLEARAAAGGCCGAELSPGELQRLSVARVLHRRPALVLLDEVTASVSPAAAAQLYSTLQGAGVTCVSVGQDCAHLRALHTHHLRMGLGAGGEGGWELQALLG